MFHFPNRGGETEKLMEECWIHKNTVMEVKKRECFKGVSSFLLIKIIFFTENLKLIAEETIKF